MASLARQIGEPARTVQLRQATLTATPSGGTATVRFGTGATAIAGVRHLASAALANGDTVWVLQQGYDLLIIGKVGAYQVGGAAQVVTEPLQFPNTITDNKINLWADSYSVGIRASTFLLRSGGVTGDTTFLFERSDGPVLARITSGGRLQVGANSVAEVYQYDSTYAGFRHKDSTAAYQIMARNTGLILVRAEGTDSRILMGTGAAWYFDLQSARTKVLNELEVAHGADRGIYFTSSTARIWTQDATWLRTNMSIYTATGAIRSDNRLIAPGSTGSSGLYLYSDTDTNFRVYHDTQFGGVVLVGWGSGIVRGMWRNHSVEVGNGGAYTRHVNVASTAWQASNASIHNNMSDPKMKNSIRPMRAARPGGLGRVKAVQPIIHKFNHDPDNPGKEYFGFNADELPDEVVTMSWLLDEDTGEKVPTKMTNPNGLIAMVWQAVQELADRLDTLERKGS